MGDDPARHPCIAYMVDALGDYMGDVMGSHMAGLWVVQLCGPVYHGYFMSDTPEHNICSCLIKSQATSCFPKHCNLAMHAICIWPGLGKCKAPGHTPHVHVQKVSPEISLSSESATACSCTCTRSFISRARS